MLRKLKIKSENSGQRLDVFLTEKLKISRSQIQKLIKGGAVLVNDKNPTPHCFLKENDVIEIKKSIPAEKISVGAIHESPLQPTATKLAIIADTPDYLVVEKPAGLPVHPDNVHTQNTLIQQIVKKYPKIKTVGDPPSLRFGEARDQTRPGVVHRLDKEASGLLVIAKNQPMFDQLKSQFQKHQVKKEYLVLVRGKVTPESGKINFPIARNKEGLMAARPASQKGLPRQSGAEAGKLALTEYEVLKYFINYSLVKVIIKTGRTHQIRVHFKALGHPIAGDGLYAVRKQKPDRIPLPRLFLHAETLGFTDLNGKYQEFHADLPDTLKDYLTKIK